MKLDPIAEQGYNLHGYHLWFHYMSQVFEFLLMVFGGLLWFFGRAPLSTLKFIGTFLFWIGIFSLFCYLINFIG